MVAFRALVMLACLILVPLAAMFGSVCPDLIRTLLIEPLLGAKMAAELCGQSGRNAAPADGLPANGSGQPIVEIGGAAPAWMGNGDFTTPADGSRLGGAAPVQAPPSFGSATTTPFEGVRASYDAPVDTSTSTPWPRFGGTSSDPSGAAGPSQTENSMGPGFQRPGPDLRGNNLSAPASAEFAGGAPATVDRFSVLERRLREYGAIYYLLETWGRDGELYRFHCKMAIANNPNVTRHFEATHREATQAMTQVLDQIEAWRAGRLK